MRLGIGTGAGPVRVGGSVSETEAASGCAFFLLILVAAVLLVWPYALGHWVAGRLGADESSPARSVLAWGFESAYVVGIVALLVGARVAAKRRGVVERQKRVVEETERHLDVVRRAASICGQVLNRLAQHPEGTRDERLPANERLLLVVSGVSLVEPRASGRGQPRVPTSVDRGEVL
jgi:hypothetical protein